MGFEVIQVLIQVLTKEISGTEHNVSVLVPASLLSLSLGVLKIFLYFFSETSLMKQIVVHK